MKITGIEQPFRAHDSNEQGAITDGNFFPADLLDSVSANSAVASLSTSQDVKAFLASS